MSALSPRRIQPRFDVNGWLFVGPALALIATFMVFPVLHSLWMSFQTGLGMRLSFAGLKNINRLFNDRLASSGKKILVLPDLFDLYRTMNHGQIMIDFGLTDLGDER